MANVDWQKLQEISQESERLRAAGQWTHAEYERLMVDAELAVAGQNRFLEFLLNREPAE